MKNKKFSFKNKDFRYKQSNKQHAKYKEYYKRKSNGEDLSFIKTQYHSRCIFLQNKERRILTSQEKVKVYNDVISTFF